MQNILIIENNKEMARIERDYLELAGYTADVVFSGSEGKQRAIDKKYDAVILEVDLPEVDGLEICKTIRERREIPVLFVSDKFQDVDIIRGLNYGADDYIQKPFSPSVLVARLKGHMGRYERLHRDNNVAHQIVEFDGLKIDNTAHRVWVDGVEKAFTTKEFEVLSFFATHPNCVFSKQELFDQIWGSEAGQDTSTVIVHIKKVREKIEKRLDKPKYIETLWGAGYRFYGEE